MHLEWIRDKPHLLFLSIQYSIQIHKIQSGLLRIQDNHLTSQEQYSFRCDIVLKRMNSWILLRQELYMNAREKTYT